MQVSRMPVREALRVLESQGIVVSEPFKGIRLAPVSEQRLNELIDVRVVLELYAIRTLINQKGHLVAENIDLFKQKLSK
ncbi:GntR family transcriptional regulator [Proteus mirabilis]|uniref:GntR family transcriptional regulator n=1 Tax=Proteus mirabilis TaxID=584 RepID=A0ABD5LZ86_PROMI